MLGLAVFGGVTLFFQRTLPSSIFLLLVLAASVNAAGYVIGLWHERTLFDESVHAFTTFAVMTAIAWVSQMSGRFAAASGFQILALTLFAGLVLGLLWEGFEWAIGIIGNRRDTLIDLAMDSLGAFVAGLCYTAHRLRRGAARA